MTRFTWANAVSTVRVLLIGPCAYSIYVGNWVTAALLFVVAVITDVCDGIIARRRGEVTPFGGLLDHGADALFVTVTLAALAAIGFVPLLLPPLVIGAFSQYVWDSDALKGAPLRASSVGRWNGIGYYALVGTAAISRALEMDWPAQSALLGAGWVLVATTLVSMADRGYALWRLRRS